MSKFIVKYCTLKNRLCYKSIINFYDMRGLYSELNSSESYLQHNPARSKNQKGFFTFF